MDCGCSNNVLFDLAQIAFDFNTTTIQADTHCNVNVELGTKTVGSSLIYRPQLGAHN